MRIGRSIATAARHAVPIGGVFGERWHPVTALGVYWLESVLLVLATATLCALIRRKGVKATGLDPKDVLGFHLGSMCAFGIFLAGIITIMIGNGYIEPMRWGELRSGAQVMALVVAVGFVLDLWRFDRFTAADVTARVDACMVRWVLLWMLGFFGFFAGLKFLFESWARLARLFGWESLKDRQERRSVYDPPNTAARR
jgi:hypothetical protein